ncbi:MAG: hypothetical protein E6G97_13675 [Alphaproteobacteria bacterium]|nr:MAG: hypothetical protein E6G97_13675 [Alphaproteobacteria bacterium]
MNAPPAEPPRRSGAQIALTLLGVVLLLPGLCSLLTMLTMIQEMRDGDSRMVDFAAIWIVTFAISAAGLWLVITQRNKRKDAEPPA